MAENLCNVISINNKPRTKVDLFLDSLELWRKPIPKDGSCFYRAVSEQLFSTQAFHGHLQNAVEEKMASRTCSFCSDSSNDTSVDFSFSLENSEVCGSYTEINLLSDIYRLNFLIYAGIDSVYSISKTGHEKQILLFFDGVHYDSVYPKSFPPEAALCQSVVYDILYRNVFEMPNEIEEAVNILRKQNKCKRVRNNKSPNEKKNGVCLDSIDLRKECDNKKPSPPLPYRVAKALDPDIFRNVEFDNWQEAKRAELLAKKLSEFQPGDKCQVILEGSDRTYHAHVQEIHEDGSLVEVFVEELGKKCQVAYDCLRHLPSSGNGGERYQTKNWRKCRKAVTMVVHINGTSQLVSSNLTSTKGKKNMSNRQPPKMFAHSKFNSSSRSIKLTTRTLKFQKNLNLMVDEDELVEQSTNDKNPAVSLNDNSICECQYCKQLLFEQDVANPEMLVASPAQQAPATDEEHGNDNNFNTFVSTNNQPSLLTNVNNNGNINDISNNDNIHNNLQFQSPQTFAVASQITINPHIWIPHLERIDNPVNINAGVSQDICGRDLPLSDMPTLRFFYNLGYEYYRAVSMLQAPLSNSPVNNNNNNASSVRYNSPVAPALATSVYYPTPHHSYTQQIYTMYPQHFPNVGMPAGQSDQYVPCVSYMQNAQYTGSAGAP